MTEQYITMCRAATELQEAWDYNNPKTWDLCYYSNYQFEPKIFQLEMKYDHETMQIENRFGVNLLVDIKELIWLPTIEQLKTFLINHDLKSQEPQLIGGCDTDDMIFDEWSYFREHYGNQNDTLEESFLKYTMLTCFKKRYNYKQKCWEAL